MITGAAGQIGYALAPMVARGAMLGPDQPVVLHLLDIEPAAQALEGVKMELLDAAFPLLHGMYIAVGIIQAWLVGSTGHGMRCGTSQRARLPCVPCC